MCGGDFAGSAAPVCSGIGVDRDYLGITAGTLNEPTGLELSARIFTGEAADYYSFSPDIPRHLDANHGVDIPLPK